MKYYCNIPCTVLADLGDEALIEVVTYAHTFEGNGIDEPPHTEPEYNRLVVLKKYLTDKKLPLEEKLLEAQAKADKALRDAEQKASSLIRDAERKAAQLEESIRKRAEKYDGLDQIISILDGEYKWVVTTDYCGVRVQKYADMIYEKDYYNTVKLRAVVFSTVVKGNVESNVKLSLSRYSDGSDRSDMAVRGFKSELEAAKYARTLIVERAKNRGLSSYDCETAEKYNMGIPEVAAKRAADDIASEQRRQREIEELTNKLAKLSTKEA